MKKLSLVALAAVLALSCAATAFAANVYTVNFKTTPAKSGTSKKPAPIGGTFGFKVSETNNQRPAALEKLTVDFAGIRINTSRFKGCAAAKIEQAQSDSVCPKASLVATGYANNFAGNIQDRSDKSISCYLSVKLYNSGPGKAALFVKGDPNLPAPRNCPISVATAIPVSIARRATGDRLSFSIPANLKQPLPTLRNSLVETQLTLAKKTVRVKGKTYGYFETFGGCKNRKRAVTATFDNEGTDADTTQSGFAPCS